MARYTTRSFDGGRVAALSVALSLAFLMTLALAFSVAMTRVAAALPASAALSAGPVLGAAARPAIVPVQGVVDRQTSVRILNNRGPGGRTYRANRVRRVDNAPAYARAAHRQRARMERLKRHRGVPVVRRGGVIAAGRPTNRYLRPLPTVRPGDIEARRAARQRTPAFTSRRLRVADGRHYGGGRPPAGEARGHRGGGYDRRPGWRPSQNDLRNVGALAGAAYAGEVVADDALNGAYNTQPTFDRGSMAVDNRPTHPGRSYSVSSDQAGPVPFSQPNSATPFSNYSVAPAPPQPGFGPAPLPPAQSEAFDSGPAAPETFDNS